MSNYSLHFAWHLTFPAAFQYLVHFAREIWNKAVRDRGYTHRKEHLNISQPLFNIWNVSPRQNLGYFNIKWRLLEETATKSHVLSLKPMKWERLRAVRGSTSHPITHKLFLLASWLIYSNWVFFCLCVCLFVFFTVQVKSLSWFPRVFSIRTTTTHVNY